jgi:hypothetical protein
VTPPLAAEVAAAVEPGPVTPAPLLASDVCPALAVPPPPAVSGIPPTPMREPLLPPPLPLPPLPPLPVAAGVALEQAAATGRRRTKESVWRLRIPET